MMNLTPLTTYHTIPIYLKPLNKNKEMWLKWVHEGIHYGIRVSNLTESIYKAQQMIDATLELEAMAEVA